MHISLMPALNPNTWRRGKYKRRSLFVQCFYFHSWVRLRGCWLCLKNPSCGESSFGVDVKSQRRTPLYPLQTVLWGRGVASLNFHIALTGHHLRRGLPDQCLSSLCFPSGCTLTYLRFSRLDLLGGLQPWRKGQTQPPACGFSSKISIHQSDFICRSWYVCFPAVDIAENWWVAVRLVFHVHWLSFCNDWGHIPCWGTETQRPE